ncbi:MAG: hypothetical protein LBM93_02815 [Oscillospiraceae bacterium]|jgi:flagellar biosynthesis/type III secretory pathway M-ring protein FliF/YscJ|nr:hypothetical protein [Oscillospiraceae bacterium]
MKDKLKKFWENVKKWWTALSKVVKTAIIVAASLLVATLIIVNISNAVKTKNQVSYIVLFKDMSASETTEVAKILSESKTDTKINSKGELMVPEKEWDKIALALAAKGYPRTTPSYGTFLDDLSMTMTDWEKQEAKNISLEQKLEKTLCLIDGVTGATVTLNIATTSDLAWEESEATSSASVMLTLDSLSPFTNENVTAVKNLVAFSSQQMAPEDVTVIDAKTGKTLLSTAEALGEVEDTDKDSSGGGGVNPALTLEEQAIQQKREIALEKAFAQEARAAVINVLAPIYGEENVEASATIDLDYDTVIQEITEYLPTDTENNLGIPTDEHVAYTIDQDLLVNDGGIVGEDENTDSIPTYQNDLEGDITSSDGTYYRRDTYWAISQIITQKEIAKGAIKSSSIGVSVLDSKNPILTEADRLNYRELISAATNIPIENVSFVSRFVAPQSQIPSISIPSTSAKFRMLIWRIIPWLAGLAFLIVCLIIMLVIYGQRKTKREVRRAELESQAAIQSLQTTLDEHKRSLQDEVEAHQAETNSTANEVRDFVKENPEITAALIRSMLRNES